MIIDRLRDSGLFTEDEIDTLGRYKADLDTGKVYGLGITEYLQDKTEGNWAAAWKAVGEWYEEAQDRVSRWKIILAARTLMMNRDGLDWNEEAMCTARLMAGELQEGGWMQ